MRKNQSIELEKRETDICQNTGAYVKFIFTTPNEYTTHTCLLTVTWYVWIRTYSDDYQQMLEIRMVLPCNGIVHALVDGGQHPSIRLANVVCLHLKIEKKKEKNEQPITTEVLAPNFNLESNNSIKSNRKKYVKTIKVAPLATKHNWKEPSAWTFPLWTLSEFWKMCVWGIKNTQQ